MLHDAKPRGYPTNVSHTGRAWPTKRPLGYSPRAGQALSGCRKLPSKPQTPLSVQVSMSTVTPNRAEGSRSLRPIFHLSSSVLSPQKYFILPGTSAQEQSSPVPRVASPRQVELGQWVQPFLFQAHTREINPGFLISPLSSPNIHHLHHLGSLSGSLGWL